MRWSKEGMLRIEMELMRQFFKPTFDKIKQVNTVREEIFYI